MSLTDYLTLGRSGLAVSPLALGTMTFGAPRWGSGEAASRGVFNAYVEAGGNFVDTADVYSSGASEEMLGGFIAERGLPREVAAAGQERPAGDKRLDGANPFGDSLFTERNWAIVDVLRRVAAEAGQTPARVALAWVTGRPGITSTLMGVSRVEQVADNIAALDVVLSPEHRAALDEVSASAPRMLYNLFTPAARQQLVSGGDAVAPWRA